MLEENGIAIAPGIDFDRSGPRLHRLSFATRKAKWSEPSRCWALDRRPTRNLFVCAVIGRMADHAGRVEWKAVSAALRLCARLRMLTPAEKRTPSEEAVDGERWTPSSSSTRRLRNVV